MFFVFICIPSLPCPLTCCPIHLSPPLANAGRPKPHLGDGSLPTTINYLAVSKPSLHTHGARHGRKLSIEGLSALITSYGKSLIARMGWLLCNSWSCGKVRTQVKCEFYSIQPLTFLLRGCIFLFHLLYITILVSFSINNTKEHYLNVANYK